MGSWSSKSGFKWSTEDWKADPSLKDIFSTLKGWGRKNPKPKSKAQKNSSADSMSVMAIKRQQAKTKAWKARLASKVKAAKDKHQKHLDDVVAKGKALGRQKRIDMAKRVKEKLRKEKKKNKGKNGN